jgi:hypothetical protein
MIRELAFARDGRLLTASTKGTLIRAFSAESGGAVAEVRLGFTQALIVALSGSDRVTVACSQSAVHAFVRNEGRLPRGDLENWDIEPV